MPTQPICGVYALTNLVTNRRYVGSSKDVANRKASHFWQMRANRHKNELIQSDFHAHGAGSFQFEVLECADINDLRRIEQGYIDSGDFTYNLAPKATGGGAQTAETIVKMSKAHTGKKHTAETIQKLRSRPTESNGGFIGYYHTPCGVFPSAYQAAEGMNGVLNFTTIRRWCHNPCKLIGFQAYKKSAYLLSIGEGVIGMPVGHLGFSFTRA